MNYSQIAEALNQTLVPNILGEETIIADDLSNIVELGTAISSLTADQLKDYTSSFVGRVLDIWLDERIYSKNINSIFRDYAEYGGIVQRVMSGLMEVTDDVSTNLQNGTTYNQDAYIGFSMNNKVYTMDAGFELDWSVPNNMWRAAFKTPMELMKLIGYITNRAEQTIRANLFATQLATLRQLICVHASGRIKLLKLYNDTFNAGDNATRLTAAEAENDAAFLKWALQQMLLAKAALRDIGALNNDGTIVTFTPDEDIDVVLLTKFASDIKVNMQSGVYHKDLVALGDYEEVNFFQNRGTQKLPDIANCGEIKQTVGEGAEAVTTHIENCVGVIYDKFACGMTMFAERTTSHYNAKGDFTNYFRRCPGHYYTDSRMNSIVFTLEDE